MVTISDSVAIFERAAKRLNAAYGRTVIDVEARDVFVEIGGLPCWHTRLCLAFETWLKISRQREQDLEICRGEA